ncbi:hypothetical protein FQN49_006187 [Arthroderma sp. PD_2]|nr:hypothetical protein FQN49_006187 [Arthroderma sp. PD_2]
MTSPVSFVTYRNDQSYLYPALQAFEMYGLVLLFYVLVASGVGAAFFFFKVLCHYYLVQDPRSKKPSFINLGKADECRYIIAGDNPFPGTTKNLLTGLQSRAGPNQGLKRAFGINNAFTSEDSNIVKGFVTLARSKVNLNSTEWESAATLAATTLRSLKFLEQASGDTDHHPSTKIVPLASLVQIVCLTVVLSTILEADMGKAGYKNILELAEEVNRIWILSKSMDEEQQPCYKSEIALQDALRAIFPDLVVDDPTRNPLNLILPAFETLWRIVLRTFLDVSFLAGSHSPEFKQILKAFFHSPTKGNFTHEVRPGISANNIIFEALRLYPPTRRVHRHFQDSRTGESVLYAADIEACHRDAAVWGPTALNFLPGRWGHIDQVQKDSFMPFGSEPFVCPAKPVFGPRIIALLVGALLCQYTEGWKLRKGPGDGDINTISEGEYLDRDACGELYLVNEIRR